MINELRLLSESLILNSDLDLKHKDYLLNSICESSDEELKCLILDGSLVELDEESKSIVNKRFDNLIENLIFILEQDIDDIQDPDQPVKKKLPINPSSLMYAMYLPTSVKTAMLTKIKLALAAGGGYIGGASLAALLGYIAYKIYQNYLSKAAQSCKDSDDKNECIKQYKKKAKLLHIQQLQKEMIQCAKSKNPDKCRNSITNKINKIKSTIGD